MRQEHETGAPDEQARRGRRTAVPLCLAVLLTLLLLLFVLCGKGCGRAGDPGESGSRAETAESAAEKISEEEMTEEETTEEETAQEKTTIKETQEEETTGEPDESAAETVLSGESLIGGTDEEESSAAETEGTPSRPAASSAAAPSAVPSSAVTVPESSAASSATASSRAASSAAAPAAPPAASTAAPSSAAASSAAAPSSAAASSTAAPSSAAPHRHSYRAEVTREATCGAPGVMTYRCACGAFYTEAIPPTGRHEWTAVTTVVRHDAATHVVHHPEQRKWVTDVPARDENIYELHAVCNGCREDLTILQRESGVTPAEHSWQHYERDGVGCGWHDEQVVVGSVHYDEIGHEEVTPAWDESVVDVPAWDETVVTGHRCAVCGAVQD